MNDLHRMLIHTTEKLCQEHCSKDVIAAAEQGEWPEPLWAALDQTGLLAVLASEEAGGVGGSFQEAALVLRTAGRYGVPLPIAETILGAELLSRCTLSVPSGPLSMAPVTQDGELQLRSYDSGKWRLHGRARLVPWGGSAVAVVVVADSPRGPMIARVPAGSYEIRCGRNLAGEPRDDLFFESVVLDDQAVAPLPDGFSAEAVMLRAALARCAMMTGALERVLEICVQYVTERVQFERPLARFQAVQHQISVLAGHVAAAAAATDSATLLADDPAAAMQLAMTKAGVSEAAAPAAAIAHQVHGAMGYTYEYPLNFLTRRLLSWRDDFGSDRFWQLRVGQHVAGMGADRIWPFLTA